MTLHLAVFCTDGAVQTQNSQQTLYWVCYYRWQCFVNMVQFKHIIANTLDTGYDTIVGIVLQGTTLQLAVFDTYVVPFTHRITNKFDTGYATIVGSY